MRSLIALALALSLVAGEALADTVNVSNVAFPLPNTNQVFQARSNRLSLKCYNPVGNAAVTVTYQSGFVFTMVPGASLWETSRVPSAKISATGTAGQILSCEEIYQ